MTQLHEVMGQPVRVNYRSMQAQNLWGWWPIIGNVGGGTPAVPPLEIMRDYSLHGLNADASIGTPTVVADGAMGWALNYDGTDDRADINTGLTSTAIASWGGWFRFDTASTKEGLISDDSDTTPKHGIQRLDSNNFVYVYLGSLSNFIKSAVISDAVWHHIFIVYDGNLSGNTNRAKIYIDGINYHNADGGTIPATIDLGDFRIGAVGGSNFPYFDGLIGDVRLYNRAFKPHEVWQLWDPLTRWELYSVGIATSLGKSIAAAPAAGGTATRPGASMMGRRRSIF